VDGDAFASRKQLQRNLAGVDRHNTFITMLGPARALRRAAGSLSMSLPRQVAAPLATQSQRMAGVPARGMASGKKGKVVLLYRYAHALRKTVVLMRCSC
jgi:hypothetical protein